MKRRRRMMPKRARMHRMQKTPDQAAQFSRRAFLVAGAQGVAALTLFGRLYYLAVAKGQQYQMLAEENRVSVRLLPPRRGRILDRDGRILAANRTDYRVYLIPEQVSDVADTLYKLGRIIEVTPAQMQAVKRQIRRQRAFLPVTVRDNLDWESFARVNVEIASLPGVQPDAGTTRWYPDGPAISQLVGYVGAPTSQEVEEDSLLQIPGIKVGKRGIEKTYEAILRGGAGSSKLEINAYGRVIRELDRNSGRTGQDVSLTIDRDLQHYAAQRLGEESAGVVVMDVHKGDVLVYASTPSFDPNELNVGISSENWRALVNDPRNPLLDKCTYGQYPPGSTFKMLVALAALKQEIIDPDYRVFCNREYPFGDRVFHCWKPGGHGWMNLNSALAQSCDCYFWDVAHRLGIDAIADYANRFGLGQTYGLDLPSESKGLVPTPAWKQATTGQPWVGGDTLNVGIGQGALLTTPLQLAVMTARLANGGHAVLPRLIHSVDGQPIEPMKAPSMDIDQTHLALVHAGMAATMQSGGTAFASRLRNLGVNMAGKTGTAQVRRITDSDREANISQDEKPWAERHHAWFVAFAPVLDPRFAICVLIEHGGGGSSAAAPVARDIMAEVLKKKLFEPARLGDQA